MRYVRSDQCDLATAVADAKHINDTGNSISIVSVKLIKAYENVNTEHVPASVMLHRYDPNHYEFMKIF